MKKTRFIQEITLSSRLTILILTITLRMFAQTNEIKGVVIQGSDLDEPKEYSNLSINPKLNDLLQAYGVGEYQIAYPSAKSAEARNCFRIILSEANDDDYQNLAQELTMLNYPEVLLERPVEITNCDNPVSYNDPLAQDFHGHYVPGNDLPCAWAITQGDPNIVVAVVDIFLDYEHDDLDGKITDIQFANPGLNTCGHGFLAAGAVAAIVNNDYCVVGSGYNTKVAFYSCGTSCGTGNPGQGILKAYADGYKIITISFSGLQLSSSMLKEITESGVTIVHSTRGTDHNAYGYLPGVIGVGQLDAAPNYIPYNNSLFWDYNVDIYAQCLYVNRLQAQNTCGQGSGNTSFGAPLVAGVIALMKSVNPNLCPSEIENIIEQSNKGFPNNQAEFPQMTQGMLSAEGAVLMAKNHGKYKITTPTIWDTDHFVSELTIEPGGELTILNANISMGDDASVIVKRNARLIIDNSTLSNCAAKWSGIKVWGNSAKEQPAINAALTDPDQCGIVVMRNNAKLEGAKTGISTSAPGLAWPDAAGYYGGLVDCSNSEFLDCRKGVEFMQYPAPLANTTLTNKSHFYNCRFEEVSNLIDGSEGVTIWDTDGIKFEKCHFYNLDSDGIVAYDAGASIIDANQFYNNNRGVLAVATYPYSSSLEVGRLGLTSNEFNGNKIHIDATATNKLGGMKVTNNEFFGGEKGVYLEGPSNYVISRNSFNNQLEGITAVNTGVMNAFQSNFVKCNTFNCTSGTTFSGENRQVQALCNTFQQTGKDITVKEYNVLNNSILGAIRTNQGSLTLPAGNCFSSPIINGDLSTSGNTLFFKYFYNQNDLNCDAIPNTGGNYSIYSSITEAECCLDDNGDDFVTPPTKDDLITIRADIKSLNESLIVNSGGETQIAALLDAQY